MGRDDVPKLPGREERKLTAFLTRLGGIIPPLPALIKSLHAADLRHGLWSS